MESTVREPDVHAMEDGVTASGLLGDEMVADGKLVPAATCQDSDAQGHKGRSGRAARCRVVAIRGRHDDPQHSRRVTSLRRSTKTSSHEVVGNGQLGSRAASPRTGRDFQIF